MWPSLEVASRIANWANGFLVASLIVGVVSTGAIVWMANVKEAYWDAGRRESAERIAVLNQQTAALSKGTKDAEARAAEANEAAAKADEAAAKANERAAELKLALEREIAAREPRTISDAQYKELVAFWKTSAKGKVTVTAKLFDEEAEAFAKRIVGVLKDSGFDVTEHRGAFSFGIPGQWIMVRDLKQWESGPTYAGALQQGFKQILHINFDGQQMDSTFPADFGDVVIVIGAKPE